MTVNSTRIRKISFAVVGGAILSVIAFSLLLIKHPDRKLLPVLTGWKIYLPGTQEFMVTRHSEDLLDNERINSLEAKSGEQLLRVQRITGIALDTALDYVQARRLQILSVYDLHRSPYQGRITQKIVCPRKFLPDLNFTPSSDGHLGSINMFANSRLTYGVCSEKEAKYQLHLVFLYCTTTQSLFSIFSYFPSGPLYKRGSINLELLQCVTDESLPLPVSDGL